MMVTSPGVPDPSPEVPDGKNWKHVEAAGASFEIPAELAAVNAQGIDGPAVVFEDTELRLTVDTSVFADPLVGHGAQPGFRQWTEPHSGDQKFLSFEAGETTVYATRLPGLTAIIHMGRTADPDTALRILRSVCTLGESLPSSSAARKDNDDE